LLLGHCMLSAQCWTFTVSSHALRTAGPFLRGQGLSVRSCCTLNAKEQRLATPACSHCRTSGLPERKTPLEPRNPA
jgi:hypothetical protein